jgi:hypothetical protein
MVFKRAGHKSGSRTGSGRYSSSRSSTKGSNAHRSHPTSKTKNKNSATEKKVTPSYADSITFCGSLVVECCKLKDAEDKIAALEEQLGGKTMKTKKNYKGCAEAIKKGADALKELERKRWAQSMKSTRKQKD